MTPILVDHNVSDRVVERLRTLGHAVTHVRYQLGARATDDDILLTASLQGRVLITHDEGDFTLLHSAWIRWSAAWGVERVHHGILLIPQSMEPGSLADAIHGHLGDHTFANELHALQADGRWLVREWPRPAR